MVLRDPARIVAELFRGLEKVQCDAIGVRRIFADVEVSEKAQTKFARLPATHAPILLDDGACHARVQRRLQRRPVC